VLAIEITDLADPRVDVYRNVRDADMRGRDGLFMAESELVLRRLLRAPHRLHSMLLSQEKLRRIACALDELPESVPVFVADLKLIHEIAAFHIHRGVLAAGHRLSADQLTLDFALGHLRRETAFTLVACEGVTNVDNMGAIFRNAAAFGVAGVTLNSECCDPLYRKAIRVSMGHVLSIPYAVSDNWLHDLKRLKNEWGATLIAAESSANGIPLWSMPRSNRTVIVLGSEGHGLSNATMDACDAVCQIPMSGDVPSINVAVASAVMLCELQRPLQGPAVH
jgi:tRNA G18 (ribose-2'-O)-methylase SpoU